MLQLNLLPNVKKELLHAKHMRNLVMTICIFVSIGAGIVVLVLGLWIGGLAIQKGIISGEVDENIAKIEKERSTNRLADYLSIQNDLAQINAVKEAQPQLSRVIDYLDVVFGRTNHIDGLNWTDWHEIKISSLDAEGGITMELLGEVDTTMHRLMLRNRLYYAMIKYSEYIADGSGQVVEGETKTDQKLFPDMVPQVDFTGGTQSEETGGWSFKATLTFNPIVFKTKYRIQAVEIDRCLVWSATYHVIGEGCDGKSKDLENIIKEQGGEQQ